MTESPTPEFLAFKAINGCNGMVVLGRQKFRTFTRNIFDMNTKELRDALAIVSNPELALKLMAVENEEAGNQVHREINRLFHNFLAASKTLVDHTRAFLGDFYKSTALQGDFQAYIKAHIADDELCRFVHDLRNYALHRELPVHTMKISYEREGAITTGVRINTRILREWNNWTKPAASFLARQNVEIDPIEIVDGYSEKIAALHDWLDTKLADFHAADLTELATLKQRHAALRSARRESEAAAAAARES